MPADAHNEATKLLRRADMALASRRPTEPHPDGLPIFATTPSMAGISRARNARVVQESRATQMYVQDMHIANQLCPTRLAAHHHYGRPIANAPLIQSEVGVRSMRGNQNPYNILQTH